MPITESMIRDINDEVLASFPNDKVRLDEAGKCLEFYNGDFHRYPVRTSNDDYEPNRFPRYSLVMQRVVNTLTGNLYKDGPKRALPDYKPAQDWLNNVYRRNCVDAVFQRADQMSMISDVAAFQVTPNADPNSLKPVKIQLWDASQFCVWMDPEDPTCPVSVAVIDMFNNQRRCLR